MFSIGFVCAGAFFLAHINSQSNKEISKANQVITMLQLQEYFDKRISKPDYCSCLLRGKVIDQTTSIIGETNLITRMPRNFSPLPPYPATCTSPEAMLFPTVGNKIAGLKVIIQSYEVTKMINLGLGYFIGDFKINFKSDLKKLRAKSFTFTSIFYGPQPFIGDLPVKIDRCVSSRSTDNTFGEQVVFYVNKGSSSICRLGDKRLLKRWAEQEVIFENKPVCKTSAQWSLEPPACPKTPENPPHAPAKIWDRVLCQAY